MTSRASLFLLLFLFVRSYCTALFSSRLYCAKYIIVMKMLNSSNPHILSHNSYCFLNKLNVPVSIDRKN